MAAAQALRIPGFMPIDSNHRAVPGMRPPPNSLFMPWARIMPPSVRRRMSTAMLHVAPTWTVVARVVMTSSRSQPTLVRVLASVWWNGPSISFICRTVSSLYDQVPSPVVTVTSYESVLAFWAR